VVSADRVFEEQIRLKFPLLADDTTNKRRRLEIADPHALAIRAALTGYAQSLVPSRCFRANWRSPWPLCSDSTQEQRLLAEVGRGRVLEISPLHQEGSLVGVTVRNHPPPQAAPLIGAPLTAPTWLLYRSYGMGCSGLAYCLGSTHPGMPFPPMDLSRIERQTAKAI
jgi:hypothetical protein